MSKATEKIKAWGKENFLVLAYFALAVLLEMTAVFVVEGSPFLSRPFLALGALLFVCGILFLIKSNRARVVVCTVALGVQAVLDLVFAVIYEMTDQYFDFGMFNLRNDAFAILESIPVDFIIFYTGLIFCLAMLICGLRFARAQKSARVGKKSVFFYVGLMLAGVATFGGSFLTYYPREAKNKYDDMIAGKTSSSYAAYGMIGNLLGEVGKNLFQKVTPIAGSDIDDFIYAKVSEPTDYFGVCKDKNVVVILAESLEWYTFLQGENTAGGLEEEYENTLNVSKEDLATLYPNLTAYYEKSLVMTNFHGREKTDIAETLSILGSYPTGAYVNYEYAGNTIPYTLPNILKAVTDGNITLRSFHNGFKSFYNREEAHPAFGFEGLTDMYDMEKMSDEAEKAGGEETFYNYMDEGERNLDSEMVKTAKDLMFPADRRFYTYITTITMHGMYYDRMNLQAENNPKIAKQLAVLEKYKPTEETEGDLESLTNLYYYMTTGLELDYMLGLMKEDLTAKGLLDKTMIVLFGDHNAYYQEMSNSVKDIPNDIKTKQDKKFTDLYNVPLMIWDKDLNEAIAKHRDGSIIDKFTCTADIVPTLLDLLGITYYENLYYGHSVFDKRASVLYSRAYDTFISDGIVRRSVKGEYYLYDGLTENGDIVANTLPAFEEEGVALVQKIKYCDYIFRQDHFGKKENYDRFKTNFLSLQK